jgi:predicted cobalt transporter CbtA
MFMNSFMTVGTYWASPAIEVMNMVGKLLFRGMLVGLLAGIVVFIFAHSIGEPLIDSAIAFEDKMAKAAGEAPEPEIVSRATQAGLGLFTAVIVYGSAAGGIFALVFAAVYGRIGPYSARMTSAILGLAAFLVISIVPDFKYPANPPSVGNPDTIGARTELYFVALIASVIALSLAVAIARRLTNKVGAWNATILGGLVFIFIVAVIQNLLPTINEVPETFSAVLLWRFRLVSLGMHAILWGALGLGFGMLAERLLETGSRRISMPAQAR